LAQKFPRRRGSAHFRPWQESQNWFWSIIPYIKLSRTLLSCPRCFQSNYHGWKKIIDIATEPR
jgi:hypothetical protein